MGIPSDCIFSPSPMNFLLHSSHFILIFFIWFFHSVCFITYWPCHSCDISSSDVASAQPSPVVHVHSVLFFLVWGVLQGRMCSNPRDLIVAFCGFAALLGFTCEALLWPAFLMQRDGPSISLVALFSPPSPMLFLIHSLWLISNPSPVQKIVVLFDHVVLPLWIHNSSPLAPTVESKICGCGFPA